MLTLKAQTRESGKAEVVRRAGFTPAVINGRNSEPLSVAVPTIDFLKILKEAGENTVVVLEGLKARVEVLIHDVERDPVSGAPIHVDFYAVEKGQKVSVAVPLEFVGVSPAVKDLGGILVKVAHELEVEAEPSKLPHSIAVDISALSALDSQIHVRDLSLPAGVVTKMDADEVVAMISVAQEEEEAPAAIDISQIEVEKKGKKEEEAPAE